MKVALYAARYPTDDLRLYPLGLGYLAAYLVTHGILSVENVCVVDSLDEVKAFDPQVVGISSTSQVINDACAFARACKQIGNSVTVLGGYHISFVPEHLPTECDIGVIGEGEKTFAELVTTAISDNIIDNTILRNIRGICFRQDGESHITASRPLIGNLDSLPFPIRQRQYSDESSIFTSRGCPYSCAYCAGPVFWKNRYRLRSADSVVKEIEVIIHKEQPREIAIMDDLWMANKVRFRQIVEELERRHIPEQVSFRGFCRSNLVYEEDILLFKRMNYRYVRFGAETGSERLLKRIKGKQSSIIHHQRVIDLCSKHEIPCLASFMFGIPGETENDINETIGFLRQNRNKLKIGGFYFFNPMPGTPIWHDLLKKKAISADFTPDGMVLDLTRSVFDWDKTHYFNEDLVPFKTLRSYVNAIRNEFME